MAELIGISKIESKMVGGCPKKKEDTRGALKCELNTEANPNECQNSHKIEIEQNIYRAGVFIQETAITPTTEEDSLKHKVKGL